MEHFQSLRRNTRAILRATAAKARENIRLINDNQFQLKMAMAKKSNN
jgi:hypothetical protein